MNYKVIGEALIPIEQPAPERPAPRALVVEPEPDTEVEIADGHATLSAPESDTGAFVVRVRPEARDDT